MRGKALIHARPSQFHHVGASGYAVAALVGLLAAGVLFVVSAAALDWDALDSRRFVLPMIAAGPVAACLLTFLSGWILDLTARVAPSLIEGFVAGPVVNLKLRAALTLAAIGCVTVVLLLVLQGSLGGADPSLDRCMHSNLC